MKMGYDIIDINRKKSLIRSNELDIIAIDDNKHKSKVRLGCSESSKRLYENNKNKILNELNASQEDWENPKWQDDKQVQQRFRDMVKTLQKAGYRVMIYTNGDGYNQYYKPNFPNLDLWLCSFRSPDMLKATHQHRIQQYSHWGEVPGVDGDVDLNVFMGSQGEWDAWVGIN